MVNFLSYTRANKTRQENLSRKTCPSVRGFKPLTGEQVFYDKFYLLVCTRNFDNFFYDKCTCSKASMLAFEQVHLS